METPKTDLERLLQDEAFARQFTIEYVRTEVAEVIHQEMASSHWQLTSLADRAGLSPARLARVLRADAGSLTLDEFARIAAALGLRPSITLVAPTGCEASRP